MSVTVSSLLILLLCVSMHGCNARNVPKAYVYSKGGQKLKLGVGSIHQRASTNEAAGKSSRFHLDAISPKAKKADSLQEEMKNNGGAKSGVIPIKSVGSVSWHVPPKNHDKNPGFHSDYSRPRTRPPCHN